MAGVSQFLWWRHLRADPNEHVLLFRAGRIKRQGRGLSAWFSPLRTSIALVPSENCQTTFVVSERTSDLQSVAVQCGVTYRFADPERAAARSNFSVSQVTARWVESPLEKVAGFLAQRTRGPLRAELVRAPLHDAIRIGADAIRERVMAAVAADTELGAMGISLVDFQVENIAPAADMLKALEAPAREAVQQKADEAMFQRRALAVEKERAIKENELNTQIELARRQDELIRRKNANAELEAEGEASAAKLRVVSESELARMHAEASARDVQTRAQGEAQAKRLLGEAEAASQGQRAAAWRETPSHVLVGLAAQDIAAKIQSIERVTIAPDDLAEIVSKLTRRASNDAK